MSDGAEIDDVKEYVKMLAKETLADERDIGSGNLYLCACILAAADRVAEAVWDVSQEVYNANHPSAE